jgi:uncharacterized SAM-binding protein YcdF (DUF218 family)
MFDSALENIQVVGPVCAVAWIVTIIFITWKPQRYFNSFLLMAAMMVTMVFIAGFFGEYSGIFLLACFIIVCIALFIAPVLLIINGVVMIKKESVCAAHLLSLGLGIVIAIGEIASVIYVLGLAGNTRLGDVNLPILFVAATVFYFSYLVLCFVIYSLFITHRPHRNNFNYVIIHGCGLAGGERVTKLLSDRVDKAIEIYEKCKVKPVLIPSGGQGADEKISEAQAMKNYLVEKGVPEADVLKEDKSATTEENIMNSKAIIDSREGRKKTALVSSNYHVYRCLRLARKAGLKCTGIGAHVALYYWPSALIREFIAVFLTKNFLIWAMIGYLVFVSPLLYAFLVE